jgi:hypothetical protein
VVWSNDIVTRVVTGSYVSSSGAPAKGRVTFRPVTRVVDVNDTVLLDDVIAVPLNTSGSFSIELPTTDNPALRPTNWAYEVNVRLYGTKPRKYFVKIPYADGSAVNLAALSGVTAPPAVPVVADVLLPNFEAAQPDSWVTDFIDREVVGAFFTPSGQPAQGRVTFTPTARVTDGSGRILIEDPIVATLDTNGSFSIRVPTTDNPNVTPKNWAYDVSVRLHGVKPQKYRLKVPFANGQSINLANVITMVDQDVADTPAQNTVVLRGPVGPMGLQGAPGSTILIGDSPPSDSLGNDGDYYINRFTSELIGPKSLGTWPTEPIFDKQARRHIHTQSSPATLWTISHGLGGRPSVSVVDSAGTVVIGEVSYNDDQTVTLSFSAPFSGYAYLT